MATTKAVIEAKHFYESETIDGSSDLGYRGDLKTGGSLGKSDTKALQTIFKEAPVVGYAGAVKGVKPAVHPDMSSAVALKAWFFAHVVNGKTDGVAYGLGPDWDLDFGGAPDISSKTKVEATGELSLATPYVPNPAVDGVTAAPKTFTDNLKANTALGIGKLGAHGGDGRNPKLASALNKAKPGVVPPAE
jgi:hypothetical protein